jgi:hypothetical protein
LDDTILEERRALSTVIPQNTTALLELVFSDLCIRRFWEYSERERETISEYYSGVSADEAAVPTLAGFVSRAGVR